MDAQICGCTKPELNNLYYILANGWKVILVIQYWNALPERLGSFPHTDGAAIYRSSISWEIVTFPILKWKMLGIGARTIFRQSFYKGSAAFSTFCWWLWSIAQSFSKSIKKRPSVPQTAYIPSIEKWVEWERVEIKPAGCSRSRW